MFAIGDGVQYNGKVYAVAAVNADQLTLVPIDGGVTVQAPIEDVTAWQFGGPTFSETFTAALGRGIDPVTAASMAQLALEGDLNRERVMKLAMKSDPNGGTLIEGWGLIFSDPDNLDLTGTYFDNMTRLLLEYYANAPLWYEHGMDPEYGALPIGKRVSAIAMPRGVWVTHVLYADHPQYVKTIDKIQQGRLGLSSDTILQYSAPNYDDQTGHFGVWPVAGWSLTEMPAEPAVGRVKASDYLLALKSVLGPAGDLRSNVTRADSKNTQTVKAEIIMFSSIEQLAQFLNCDPTVDAVDAALTALLAQLEGMETAPEMAAAMGMDAKLPGAAIGKALSDLYTQAKQAGATPTAAPMNYAALSQFAASARKSANTPVATLPYFTGQTDDDADQDDTEDDSDGKRPTPAPQKSTQYGTFNINRGVRKPGILSAIKALAENRPEKAGSAFSQKSILGTDNVTGGYMLNRQLSNTILKPLYAQEIVLAMGAQTVPMDGIETLTTRKMKSGGSAYWGGSGVAVSDTSEKWAQHTLALKELVAEVIVPNKLLRNAGPEYERTITDDLITAMRLKMDRSFLLGAGAKPTDGGSSGAEPIGVLNFPNVTITYLGANGAQPKLTDLTGAIGRLEDADVEDTGRWGWAMSPRSKRRFTDVADANGQPLLRQDWTSKAEQAILGYQYRTTTQIPNNVTRGTSTAASWIFLGDWSQCVVGMGMDVSIVVDTSRYVRERQTLIQGVAYVDFGIYYPEAFQVLGGVL